MCRWVILARLSGLKKEALVLTGGCGEGILGGLGGRKGQGGYDQNTLLACAKFSKSTLKYTSRCKQRRQENGKRGGNKSPPSPNRGSITVAPASCPLLSFKSLGGYYKELTTSKVFLCSALQKQFSSAIIYEYFLACGWYFSVLLHVNNFQLFVWKKGRFFLY